MSLGVFSEGPFRARVSAAIEAAKKVLDNERSPSFPADVPHEYVDKYILAEFLTSSAVAATWNIFKSVLGVTDKHLATMRDWAKTRTVTLRFKAEEACKFLRKVEREVKSDTTHVNESTLFGTSKSYSVTKVTEWFWQFDATYALLAYQGNNPEAGVTLVSRSGTVELKTTNEYTPKPASLVRPSLDLTISWLLKNLDETGKAKFSIDRKAKSCHTPRRNDDITTSLNEFRSLHYWAGSVQQYFTTTLFPVQTEHGLDLSWTTRQETGVFVPVAALFDPSKKDAGAQGSGVVPLGYMSKFLDEEMRSLNEKFKEIDKVYPTNSKLITAPDARICFSLNYIRQLAAAHSEGVDSIEEMLRKQLVAAIGKEVQPSDFSQYLRFHYRKIFKSEFQPKGFSYAIRRPDHYPEGTLSLEANIGDGSLADPMATMVHSGIAAKPMKFALDASTYVSFGGERHLHGFIAHKFSGVDNASLNLVARARQFSSFIVLIGRIASADLFEPKYAMIVKDRDEFTVPLSLETIPTPKEFKDAIESLSPEQQRFAKAYEEFLVVLG